MSAPFRTSGSNADATHARISAERGVAVRIQTRLLDAVRQAIVATDRNGFVTFWNPGAESLYKWTAAEAIGQNIVDLVVTERSGPGWVGVLAQIDDGVECTIERQHIRKDGSIVPVLLSLSPLRDDSGRPEGVIGISIDLTDRKNLEEQFRQAQKMEGVGRLASGIAHDFNNVLTAISIGMELLAESFSPDDPRTADAAQILEAANRGSALTKQLLGFSRKQPIAARRIDVNEIIAKVVPMLDRLMGKRIELSTALRGTGSVIADPGQLEQVMVNLVVNARDAMPNGGPVMIETADSDYGELTESKLNVNPGRYLMIAVSDSGTGMDKLTRDRAMEPFFTTKPEGSGTGLGLSTVFGIVKQFGGHVWIYSEPGAGTTVKVFLPQADQEAGAAASVAETAANHSASETVLLVEDDLTLRGLAAMILEEQGYRVLPAGDGREALQIAREYSGPIDLIVTDVVMPQMTGRELVDRLKDSRPEMRTLYISGYTNDEIVRRGVLDRSMELLQKPFTASSLLTKVRAKLDDE